MKYDYIISELKFITSVSSGFMLIIIIIGTVFILYTILFLVLIL